VTGASSGIGAIYAERLARRGKADAEPAAERPGGALSGAGRGLSASRGVGSLRLKTSALAGTFNKPARFSP